MPIAYRLRTIATTALGLVLACVPLALWVAWTATGLLAVACVGAVSAAMLVWLTDDASPEEVLPPRRLSEESIAELQQIFPLTYHHSLVERSRFQEAMSKLRKQLE
jgi:hypothetical protein